MRFIGFFTGRNKYDEFLLEQIEVRSRAIRTTMSKKMSLARNYSIHEIMALSQMFIDENEDDELIEDDVASIESLTEELRRNYVISDSKVYAIIQEKERNELPIEDKKISKREMKEIETLRFLHKYGYDGLDQANVPDPKYQDTHGKRNCKNFRLYSCSKNHIDSDSFIKITIVIINLGKINIRTERRRKPKWIRKKTKRKKL